eukprot:Nitzschia sp. Nitz4//scaffold36_size144017//76237//78126//NITZ4_003097-RA/size144017-processed-gene-0.48-mRNA-1//1//CDS//3329549489//5028//frame0
MAPCWGAAFPSSPLVGNLTRFKHSLASKLFWQPDRWSPLQLSRVKSQPVAHLTPSSLANLWVASQTCMDSPKRLRELLRNEGIQSNYVGERVWTGVSLARWTDLISNLSESHRDPLPLAPALWLSALWELARTKRDLLDYLLALDMYVQQVTPGSPSIFDDSSELAQALVHDEASRKEWSKSSFEPSLLDPAEALQDLLSFEHISSYEASRCLERVCASRAIQHVGQPVVPNGRYSYDGGDVKPDCVEVSVRELFNLLLWDESTGEFAVDRLPPSTRPELVELYARKVDDSKPIGQAWFDMLSNISGCDYLTKSPNGQPYELTPTLANVSHVVQILLGLESSSKWTTLEELAVSWNAVSMGGPTLHVTSRKTSHRGAMSDELQHHELATLHLEGAQNGIELKLDKAHGIATVSHVRRQNNQIESEDLHRLRVKAKGGADPLWSLVCLAIMGDYGIQSNTKEMGEASILLDVFAAPLGPDRRSLIALTSTSDLDIESKVHEKAMRESQRILSSSVVRTCSLEGSPELKGRLLTWLLQESPVVFPEHETFTLRRDYAVEKALLTLPIHELSELPLRGNSWACRGNDLYHAVSFLQRQAPLTAFLWGDNPASILSRLSLLFRLSRNKQFNDL